MQELNGKVAIITGAASGIGKAITTAFINENCFVVAADQSRERLTQLATIELNNVSSQAITCVTDMSKEDEIEHMISMALKQYGKLDILVNNAGIMDHFEPVAEVSNLRWEQVMKVNLEGFDMESLPAKTKERIIAGTQTNPRFGTPEEIANVAVFVASEKSSFVNGAIVTVDGGWTAY